MERAEVVEQVRTLGLEPEAFVRLLAGRYSCRAFLPDSVPKEKIACVLSMAQLTASWCNSQSWQVLITGGAATERFREAYAKYVWGREGSFYDFPPPARYEGVYAERRRDTAWQLYEAVGVARGDKLGSLRQSAQNFRLFGAPHVAIITTEADLGVYGAVDCGAYVSNFMLAAQSLGLATIAQASLALHAPFVREHFGLPAHRPVLCGISFGYADPAHPANRFRTPRADLADVVTFVGE